MSAYGNNAYTFKVFSRAFAYYSISCSIIYPLNPTKHTLNIFQEVVNEKVFKQELD